MNKMMRLPSLAIGLLLTTITKYASANDCNPNNTPYTGYALKLGTGCSEYVNCVNGVVVESMSCPIGTLYDGDVDAAGVCAWEDSVECKDTEIEVTGTTSAAAASSPAVGIDEFGGMNATDLDMTAVWSTSLPIPTTSFGMDGMMGMECPETCPAEICESMAGNTTLDPNVYGEACNAGLIKDCYGGEGGFMDAICGLQCADGFDPATFGITAEDIAGTCSFCSFMNCCDGMTTFDECKGLLPADAIGTGPTVAGVEETAADSTAAAGFEGATAGWIDEVGGMNTTDLDLTAVSSSALPIPTTVDVVGESIVGSTVSSLLGGTTPANNVIPTVTLTTDNPNNYYCGSTDLEAADLCLPCPSGSLSECTDPSHGCFAGVTCAPAATTTVSDGTTQYAVDLASKLILTIQMEKNFDHGVDCSLGDWGLCYTKTVIVDYLGDAAYADK
jgi:hypothetical protein